MTARYLIMNNYATQQCIKKISEIVVISRLEARIKFGVTGQESNLQSATIHSATRWLVMCLKPIVTSLYRNVI